MLSWSVHRMHSCQPPVPAATRNSKKSNTYAAKFSNILFNFTLNMMLLNIQIKFEIYQRFGTSDYFTFICKETKRRNDIRDRDAIIARRTVSVASTEILLSTS